MGSRVDDRTGLGLGTSAARLGAGTVTGPTGNLAINGASESVASGGSRESGTGNTAVSSSVHYRTRLGLGTSATGLGASTIGRPAGDLAINGASESVACGGGRQGGADNATVSNVSYNFARLGLGTSATRLGAGTVARPGRDLAVNWATLGVAHAVFRCGALIATMFGGDVNSVVTRLHATATGLGASGPGVPGVRAIDGARVGVAVLLRGDRAADSTTVLASSDDGLGAGLNTTTTDLRASGPSSPARDSAVNGAVLVVASAVLGYRGAFGTANSGHVEDGTRTELGPSATGCSASTVGSVARDLAVDGTSKSVAGGGNRQTGAANTTVGTSSYNGTRLGLGTSATGLGAGTVARPARDLAVNRASLAVAHAVFRSRAGVATVLGRNVNSVSARLAARATGLGASRPGVPGVLAIDGARVGVAVLLSRHRAASSATKLASSDDGLGSGLDAAATDLRASGPSSPAGDSAVNGAGERVASGRRRESGARKAAVGSGSNDGTSLGLGTSATGLSAGTVL
jgi:hypothetical protein